MRKGIKINLIYKIIAHILAQITNALCTIVECMSPFFLLFVKPSSYFQGRSLKGDFLPKLSLSEARKRVLIYCSSAGEYEQALPLAHRLEEKGVFVHIVLFSHSGLNFAKKRKERLSYSLAPFDRFKNWNKIFDKIRPDIVLIVRHEVWPCFLFAAKSRAKVCLINGSLKSFSFSSLFFKRIFFRYFEKICVVSDLEKQSFLDHFQISHIQTTGDTKYDRVLERVVEIRERQRDFPGLSSDAKKVIIGSAWDADVDLVFEAFVKLKEKTLQKLQLIVAPHQPNQKFKEKVLEMCQEAKLSFCTLSEAGDFAPDVLFIDSIGILFELYAHCDCCFVGGALHFEVHNVLEPIAFDLPVAFGPNYKNSHEAVELVKQDLAKVLSDSQECQIWLEEELFKEGSKETLRRFMEAKSGASDLLLQSLASYL